MLSKLKRIGQESIRIAKWYDNNGYVEGIRGDEDHHADYHNMIAISSDVAGYLEAIKNFRVQYNYKGGGSNEESVWCS